MMPAAAGKLSGDARARLAQKRQQSVLVMHIAGVTVSDIARRLGVSLRTIQRDLVDLDDARIRVEELLEDHPVDAADLHLRLSQMFDADYADICDLQTGKFKPLDQWPVIWRRMLSGVDVKELFERSKDGGASSWDAIGHLIKIKWADPLKVIELLAQLKAVDALQQRQAGGDVHFHAHLHAEITERLNQALERENKMITVTPTPNVDD